MDAPTILEVQLLIGGVEAVAKYVEDVSQGTWTHRHGDRAAGVDHPGSPLDPVCRSHADGPNQTFADVSSDLGDDFLRTAADTALELQGVVNFRQTLRRKVDVDHGADDCDHVLRAVRHRLDRLLLRQQPLPCSSLLQIALPQFRPSDASSTCSTLSGPLLPLRAYFSR